MSNVDDTRSPFREKLDSINFGGLAAGNRAPRSVVRDGDRIVELVREDNGQMAGYKTYRGGERDGAVDVTLTPGAPKMLGKAQAPGEAKD